MILDSDAYSTPSSTLTAAALALLGYFALGGRDEDNLLLELDLEINDISNGTRGDTGGGDSRYHGRSAIPRRQKEDKEGLSVHRELSVFGTRSTAALVPPVLNPNHHVLTHRRYSPCISDLKCVLNVSGMARHFAALKSSPNSSAYGDCALDDWISTLAVAQMMDGQMWRSWGQGHVESEPKGWVGAFNASISLGSLFERLLFWDDSDPTPISNCATPVRLLSCAELTHYTLTTGLHRWQRLEMLSYRPSPPPSPGSQVPLHALCPASLPFSTVASAHGSALAMAALPVSQIQRWSFHLPLHRFIAACIREVSRRSNVVDTPSGPCVGGMSELLQMFAVPGDVMGKDARPKLRLNALLFRGLMEFPTIVLSRAAQIRAGLWKRNGPGNFLLFLHCAIFRD